MNRHPAGTSVGGRFASVPASEVPDDLADDFLPADQESTTRRMEARQANIARARLRSLVPESAATVDADAVTVADDQGRPVTLDVRTRARLRSRLEGVTGVIDMREHEVEEKRFLVEQERS